MVDIKDKSIAELESIAKDIREQIMVAVDRYGGHLASNLGIVELTIALHYVFDLPFDKLVFDVGHQVYAHKILSGRSLQGLRQDGGVTGFPNPTESEYDLFTVGHASTAISSAVGLARARDLLGQSHSVIAVIGDGALGGGMAYEALNDLGASGKKVIVILNDNKMSISKNVGAMSRHLAKLRLNKGYAVFKNNIKRGFAALPIIGKPIVKLIDSIKDSIRFVLFKGSVIQNLGIKYYGPFDGHSLKSMISILRGAKNDGKAVFLHFVTEKGKGVELAENDPLKYHGLPPNQFAKDVYKHTVGKEFCPISYSNAGLTQHKSSKFEDCNDNKDKSLDEQSIKKITVPCTPNIPNSTVLADCLIQRAKVDNSIVAITAAMGSGTGLEKFGRVYGDRYFDVGIAEQHAVTMAAALAKAGLKPYFGVYSTFLQRAFDQIIHDMMIDVLPVRLCIDRAGVVSGDGITHQGIFDISYLYSIPDIAILQPKDSVELKQMLELSFEIDKPIAIRYPKECAYTFASHTKLEFGKWEWLSTGLSDIVVLAVGDRCIGIAIEKFDTVNCRFIRPLDKDFLDAIKTKYKTIITIEDGVVTGGFGSQVRQYLAECNCTTPVYNIGYKGFVKNLDANKSIDFLAQLLDDITKKIGN